MTKSGWVSAGILGTILWGCLSWQGWMSVVIYLLFGSLVTKIGFKFKKAQGISKDWPCMGIGCEYFLELHIQIY